MEYAQVQYTDGLRAHEWHVAYTKANSNLLHRDELDYMGYIARGFVWGARNQAGDYVGLAYSIPTADDSGTKMWEVGGLMIDPACKKMGIGGMLVRATLANTLFEHTPLKYRERVIAHVHRQNKEPRILLERMGFHHHKSVVIPANLARNLKPEADGNVHGDEFQFSSAAGLENLATWCDKLAKDQNGATPAGLVLREGIPVSLWAEALRTMIPYATK